MISFISNSIAFKLINSPIIVDSSYSVISFTLVNRNNPLFYGKIVTYLRDVFNLKHFGADR